MRIVVLFPLNIFITLSLVLFIINTPLVHGQCQNDQRSILLQLKNELEFDSSFSTKLVTWNESLDCCGWGGITCVDGRVTGLDLSDESISDGLSNSSSLFSLLYLRNLSLAFNHFDYLPIPSSIGNLKNLIHLNLSNGDFSGQIPKEISNLKGLLVLDLSTWTQFSTPGDFRLILQIPNLKMFVQNFSELSQLYLDSVNISATGSEWCQALSASLPKLKVMSMSSCYLSGPLDSSLLKLQSLSVICLDNNNLATEVPEFFANFSKLTVLQLSGAGLYGTFPQQIFQIPSLQTLDISKNNVLTGSLPEFPHNSSLQILRLADTRFFGTLPNSSDNLKRLSMINLSGCNFSGKIPDSFGKLLQLVYVDLSMNRFTGNIPSLSLAKNLDYVDLSSNRFTGNIPSLSLAKNLSVLKLSQNMLDGPITSIKWHGLSKLVRLDLQNNSLNGSIPISLLKHPSLLWIDLSYNQFNGKLNLLANGSSSPLEELDLSSNRLSGSFPTDIFGLQGLRTLSLSFNNFSGRLPINMIQQLKNIESLDLSYNGLSINDDDNNSSYSSYTQLRMLELASCGLTKFPQFLKNQSTLAYLDLSENHIYGAIPEWLWKLDSLGYLNLSYNFFETTKAHLPNISSTLLFVLDLHSNNLQGPIPVLPKSIEYLDYSSNNISSVIPNDIGDSLSSTSFFSLANNNFRGNIPTSICNTSSLEVLDLSTNSLSGRIPECLTTISSLQVLNLRRNHFIGTISNSFPTNCSLRTLDLSGNKLEGQVPVSLASCKTLEVLNLGNNHFFDVFPHWLNGVSSLRVLVLQSNKFHGSLECQECNITWPRLQIVDLSLNNFGGKLPQGCFKTWKAMTLHEEGSQSKLTDLQYEFLVYGRVYYENSVTVTNKGHKMQLRKILNVFTAIDLSRNKFEGPIPDEVGDLEALIVLSLSHNALTGQVPPSLGNLKQLESLDLSSNGLNGTIPMEIASLNFLEFLNFSHNQLVGRIPTGSQLQLFPKSSFQGNPGLCGDPLEPCAPKGEMVDSLPPSSDDEISWMFISTIIGYLVGIWIIVMPPMFCIRWRKTYCEFLDGIIYKAFPQFDPNNRSREAITAFRNPSRERP